MTLPHFATADDPGPSFSELLQRMTGDPPRIEGTLQDVVHGTTIVAVRTADGVVLAGDRRATAGNIVAHRTMDKVLPADFYSGVGIAGAAGPAMEMVRLFQTELEHYEKVEGTPLSLEGKANKLSQMVRQNLPAAFQGMAVVPVFAGYDERRGDGRLFSYDVTGGRYEETDFATAGSGGRDARTVIKMGWRPGLATADAVSLVAEALYEAADEDTATGGPDTVRGIYPRVAVVDREGFRFLDDAEVASSFDAIAAGRREQGSRG
jgi:proteasome beta subunit